MAGSLDLPLYLALGQAGKYWEAGRRHQRPPKSSNVAGGMGRKKRLDLSHTAAARKKGQGYAMHEKVIQHVYPPCKSARGSTARTGTMSTAPTQWQGGKWIGSMGLQMVALVCQDHSDPMRYVCGKWQRCVFIAPPESQGKLPFALLTHRASPATPTTFRSCFSSLPHQPLSFKKYHYFPD